MTLVENALRAHEPFATFRLRLFALAALSAAGCTEPPPPTAATAQAVINPPLPSNLNLILNAKTTVTVGSFASVFGDVASGGASGSVLFDAGASQGFGGFNVLPIRSR